MKIEILSCEQINQNYILKTKPNDIFYIDGKGGQLGDRGNIGTTNVLEVTKDGIICDNYISPGIYEYNLDLNRRNDISQQHTAQHIFSALAYNKFNYNTVGFRMAEEYTTVDLDSNNIHMETVEILEKEVNKIISQSIELKKYTLPQEEASQLKELRKSIDDKVTGDVNFIEIPEVDLASCGGFHVENTAQLKIFKILSHEKIKGKYTRFYFLAGDRVYNDYKFKNAIIKELSQFFSCKNIEILDYVDKLFQEKQEIENQFKNLSYSYAEDFIKKHNKDSIIIYIGNKFVCEFIPKLINDNNHIVITGNNNNYSISSTKFNCKDIIKLISSNFNNIKGGGSETKGNFKGDININSLKILLENFLQQNGF